MNHLWTIGTALFFTFFFWLFGYLVQPELSYFVQLLLGVGVVTFCWFVLLLSMYFYVNWK